MRFELADDGQLEIDKSKIFQEEIGQWNDPCFVRLQSDARCVPAGGLFAADGRPAGPESACRAGR